MEASLDEFWPLVGRKQLVCASEMCPEDTFCLYLVSSFNEVVVGRSVRRSMWARFACQWVSLV